MLQTHGGYSTSQYSIWLDWAQSPYRVPAKAVSLPRMAGLRILHHRGSPCQNIGIGSFIEYALFDKGRGAMVAL